MATQLCGGTVPTHAHPGDRDLVPALRAGDLAALETLVSRYRPSLVAYATRLLDGSEMADDIVQEVFLRLWTHRVEWSSTSCLRPLLFRITRNLALNEKRRVRVRLRGAARILREETRGSPSPAEETEEGELRSRIDAAIASLPRRRREVFVLARFQNLTFAQIAAVLGISPQTVANQMSAALAHLRRELRPFLVEEPEAPANGRASGGGVF